MSLEPRASDDWDRRYRHWRRTAGRDLIFGIDSEQGLVVGLAARLREIELGRPDPRGAAIVAVEAVTGSRPDHRRPGLQRRARQRSGTVPGERITVEPDAMNPSSHRSADGFTNECMPESRYWGYQVPGAERCQAGPASCQPLRFGWQGLVAGIASGSSKRRRNLSARPNALERSSTIRWWRRRDDQLGLLLDLLEIEAITSNSQVRQQAEEIQHQVGAYRRLRGA